MIRKINGGVNMKKILGIGVFLLLLLGIGYSAGVGYYAQKFQANTKFGSIDISNLTLEQAQKKIEEDINKKELTLLENGKELGRLSLAELNAKVNTKEVLEATYNSQDPQMWMFSFFGTTSYDNVLLNSIEIDSASLSTALNNLNIVNDNRIASQDAKIEYANGRGYYVEPEKTGNQLDLEKVKTMVVEGLQAGAQNIEVNTSYLAPKVTSDDEKITSLMTQIDKVANTKLTLTIAGQEVAITREQIMEWIHFDENNQVVISQEPVMEFLATLNEKYATYNKSRQFQSTLQGTVTVQPGTLGWSIDRESETEQIVADLLTGGEIKREPAIVGTGYNTGGDDIGSSYVEVDMTNQTMFIYIDGQQALSTPIVTGAIGSNTIPGAYSVWNKEENAVLRGTRVQSGTDYEQPVSFWLPFDDTGQGIHDANWQSSFGGEAYLYSGSQGCINTPPDVMPRVFELVSLGMPVIVFQ